MENNAKRWLAFTATAWLLLSVLAGSGGAAVSPFVWLALSQLLLVLGGAAGSRSLAPRSLRWRPGEFARGIAAGVGLFFLNIGLLSAVILGLGQIWGLEAVAQRLAQERAALEVLWEASRPFFMLPLVLSVVVLAPLGEELFFRGLLLPLLARSVPWFGANGLTALIFAAVHGHVVQFVPIFAAGLILGGLYRSKGSIWRPLAAHAAANFLSLGLLVALDRFFPVLTIS